MILQIVLPSFSWCFHKESALLWTNNLILKLTIFWLTNLMSVTYLVFQVCLPLNFEKPHLACANNDTEFCFVWTSWSSMYILIKCQYLYMLAIYCSINRNHAKSYMLHVVLHSLSIATERLTCLINSVVCSWGLLLSMQ